MARYVSQIYNVCEPQVAMCVTLGISDAQAK